VKNNFLKNPFNDSRIISVFHLIPRGEFFPQELSSYVRSLHSSKLKKALTPWGEGRDEQSPRD
jgi:hypothetical protein